MDCEKVGVAGLGLIGASIAQGLAGGFARTVIGFDPDRRARTTASTSVSSTTNRLEDLRGADLIVLAAPPSVVPELIAQIAAWPPDQTILTDVASVKANVADAVPTSLRARFVPGHPMSGHETTGAAYARPDLFHGANWVLCPFPEASENAMQTARSMVRHLRALPVLMDPLEHDRHVALLSHLPHVLASALLLRSASLDHGHIQGGSWRDLTRVGGSNPMLWADILIANKSAVLNELDQTSSLLVEFRKAIEADDVERLKTLIQDARGLK